MKSVSIKKVLLFDIFFLLLFVTLQTSAQESEKKYLLKGVTNIPLPDSPNYVCATYIIGKQPEVIATAKAELGRAYHFNAIVTSVFGKGKIIVFGSS